jgi:enoyl-CoA hydratase/carnithine racemase
MYHGLTANWRDGVCTLTLDEPERLNPLSERVRRRLDAAVRRLGSDQSTRVVVLRGAGRAFSAGVDLDGIDRSGLEALSWSRRRRLSGAWQRTLAGLEAVPQPAVAVLHGWVVGGAALLACCCDLRLAADDMRLSILELRLGIPLTWAGLPRLVREIGLARTRDLVMTGRSISAQEALGWGLVQRVVPAGHLNAAADALVEELMRAPSAALSLTKEALNAIGRAASSEVVAWADADLLAWSMLETESQAAAAGYMESLRTKRLSTAQPGEGGHRGS